MLTKTGADMFLELEEKETLNAINTLNNLYLDTIIKPYKNS